MAKIIVTLVPRTNRAKLVPMVTELSHINRTLSKTVWHKGTMWLFTERWNILLRKKIINLLVAHPLRIHCSFDYSGKAAHPPSRSPRFSIPGAVSPQCSAFITSINGLFALRSNQSAILTDTRRLFSAWSVWKATKGKLPIKLPECLVAPASSGICFLF